MIELDIGRLMGAHNAVCAFGQMMTLMGPQAGNPALTRRDMDELKGNLQSVIEIASNIEMAVTASLARTLHDELLLILPDTDGRFVIAVGGSFERIAHASTVLQAGLKAEANTKWFLSLGANGASLWNPAQPLFGDDVDNAFPSAADDIAEAGKCLAVERGTAAVMHLMRASEVGLIALAKAVGVRKQNDWGKYLERIGTELAARMAAAGKHTPDEEFYANAAIVFDPIRRARRNKTMHVDLTYTVERATEIFSDTRSLMRHLATRLAE